MTTHPPDFASAEQLRKEGRFAEAEAIFRAIWEASPSPGAGWRMALCVRKRGAPAEALALMREVYRRFPEDAWVRSEAAWCVWAADLKPAGERLDVDAAREAARKMLALSDNALVLRLAVFGVVDAAREKGRWDVVSEWCDRLAPADLDQAPRRVGEAKLMADRERWYFAKVKALIHLERWGEARAAALEAAGCYPRRADFPRWAAAALLETGDPDGAARELEALVRQGDPPWYVLADLARLELRRNRFEAALRAGARAALHPGAEEKAGVRLFLVIARAALALGRREVAAAHAALSRFVREREGWPVDGEALEVERGLAESAPPGETPPDIPADERRRAELFRAGWLELSGADTRRRRGRVGPVREDRSFAFILPEDGGAGVFVLLRDLPRAARREGTAVSFRLEESFDRKRNCASVRAVDLRPEG